MATQIQPALGAGALMVQQGPGTDPGFNVIDVRRMATLGLQEGVYGASDFMVVQRGAGANMSVDVGMPAGGFACVQGDTVAGQGLYFIPVHSSTVNQTLNAADASNARIDQIVLSVHDNVLDATGQNNAEITVLTGTATAGATLDTRTGAAPLTGSTLLLADVLVGAGVTSVDNTKIRDRRKWARGAFRALAGTNNGTNYTVTNSTEPVDSTNLAVPIECSGNSVRVMFSASMTSSTAGSTLHMRITLDGVGWIVATTAQLPNAGQYMPISGVGVITVGAGRHTFALEADATGTSPNVANAGGYQPRLTVEEILRPSVGN